MVTTAEAWQPRKEHNLKIDVFSHIMPAEFLRALKEKVPSKITDIERAASPATLYDLDLRFRIMDKYGEMLQVLTLAAPPPEMWGDRAIELTRIANDEMAELVTKYPDRFVAAVASLPMNNIDAALKEADRAIQDLRFRGVQIFSSPNGEPIDAAKFWPLFEKMSQYNLPIWLHPETRAVDAEYPQTLADVPTILTTFRWPYDTTIALARLVYGGVMEKYPNLKVIAHHCGAMVPFFAGRIAQIYDTREMRARAGFKVNFTIHPIDYFRKFYGDTVTNGDTPALMSGYQFFGVDHLLFGTDMPYDHQLGDRTLRQTIRSVQAMDIPDDDKRKIFVNNAKKILRLPVD